MSDDSDSTFAPRGASDSDVPPSAEDVLSAAYPQWIWGRARTSPQGVDSNEDLAPIGDQQCSAQQLADAPQSHSALTDGVVPVAGVAPTAARASAGAQEPVTYAAPVLDPAPSSDLASALSPDLTTAHRMVSSSAAAPDEKKAAGADETTSSQRIDPLAQLGPGTHPRDLKVLIAAVIVLCIVLVMLAVDRNKDTDSGSAVSPVPSPTVSVSTTAIPAWATQPISAVG